MLSNLSKTKVIIIVGIIVFGVAFLIVSLIQMNKINELEKKIDLVSISSDTSLEPIVEISNTPTLPTSNEDLINDKTLDVISTSIFNSLDDLQWKKYRVASDINVEFEAPTIMEELNSSYGFLQFTYTGINTQGNEGYGDTILFSIEAADEGFFGVGEKPGITPVATGRKLILAGKESKEYTKDDYGDGNICSEGWEVVANKQGKEVAFHFCANRKDIGTTEQIAKEKVLYEQILKRIRDSISFIEAL